MKPLDMRDIAIIDAFPVYAYRKTVLNVGCGEARIDFHLARRRYRVYGTDIKWHEAWKQGLNRLSFHISDIFDLSTFPVKRAPVVICSEVLEHLPRYKEALKNLLALTAIRLIMTVPHMRSFGGKNAGHCNFWGDERVHEFIDLCKPNSVAISRIRTKPDDVRRHQWCYLIIVDKRQDICFPGAERI